MTPRAPLLLARTVGIAGLAVTIVGTFLPWLGSGSAERNSYAAGGAVRTLMSPSRPVQDLLGLWPLLGMVAAAAVAALVLGRAVVALGLALVVAAVAGGGALAVLPMKGNRYAHVLSTGPLTTLAGATLIALAGVISLVLALARRPT
ncbi:hypothetical protein [Jatrophihabitans sp.]|uniref:hypothetical protein n=1 Tax=Jatrophihabitans sp. TaxID=1932789 RepID=UPI0030C6D569|nr:hypothetical protein [Jatrophihabitans sp.]